MFTCIFFTVVQKVCQLIGVSVGELTKAFLHPRVRFGSEDVAKSQTKDQVTYKSNVYEIYLESWLFQASLLLLLSCLFVL